MGVREIQHHRISFSFNIYVVDNLYTMKRNGSLNSRGNNTIVSIYERVKLFSSCKGFDYPSLSQMRALPEASRVVAIL